MTGIKENKNMKKTNLTTILIKGTKELDYCNYELNQNDFNIISQLNNKDFNLNQKTYTRLLQKYNLSPFGLELLHKHLKLIGVK